MDLCKLLNSDEDNCYGVILGIKNGEYDSVSNVEDEITSNEGWYNYYKLTFDIDGFRYSIEYREHTSDNVSDEEVYEDSLECLGEVEGLENEVTKESLEKLKSDYERQISSLNEHIEKTKTKHRYEIEQLNKHKDLNRALLKQFNESLLSYTANFLTQVESDVDNNTLKLTELGEFLIELNKLR